MGINVTGITEDEYGSEDLGGPLEFFSYGQVLFYVDDHWALGGQIAHMSNADLQEDNAGVNSYMGVVSYRF